MTWKSAIAALMLPQAAWAHSPVPGIEGFYTGLIHPLSSPGQILALLALGLMLGMRWPHRFIWGWASFATVMLVGLWLGFSGFTDELTEPLLIAIALLAAAAAALYPPGFVLGFVAFSGLAGGLIGIASTPDDGPLMATFLTAFGSVVGANLILLYLTAGVGWLRENGVVQWRVIGLRVAAAWVAAIAVLMTALFWAGAL